MTPYGLGLGLGLVFPAMKQWVYSFNPEAPGFGSLLCGTVGPVSLYVLQ